MPTLSSLVQQRTKVSKDVTSQIYTPTDKDEFQDINNTTEEGFELESRSSMAALDAKTQSSRMNTFIAINKSLKDIALKTRGFKLVQSFVNKGSVYPLHDAAMSGDVQRVQSVLKTLREGVNGIDDNKMAPLHYAAKKGDPDIATILLDSGAFIDLQTRLGTPLQMALRYRKADVAAFLLRQGASVDLTDIDGMNALHLAVDNRLTNFSKELIAKFMVDVNAMDVQRNTALHYAAINDDVTICEALVDNGASVDAVNRCGETALHLAAGENNINVLNALLNIDFEATSITKDAFMNMKRNDAKTALMLAAQRGNFEIASILIENGADTSAKADDDKSIIHLVAVSGNQEAVRLLLESSALSDLKDENARTPLHDAVSVGDYDIAKMLLTNEDVVNAKDNDGTTPFLLAVQKDNYAIAKLLLENGAIASDQDCKLKSGLHYAVANGNFEMLTMLLNECKALIRAKDEENRLPLHYAAEFGNSKIMKYLLRKTTRINDTDNHGEAPLHIAAKLGNAECVEMLARNGEAETLDIRNSDGQTPLHLAAIQNQPSVCMVLLQCKAMVNPIDRSSWTPFQYAASYDYEEVLRIILLFDANVNYADNWGNTALMIAAEMGRALTVKLLVESGADLVKTNRNGKTFLDLALEFQREAVCKAVLNSDRWREALLSKMDDGRHFMGKLIEQYPDLAEIVLNRSTSFSDHHPEDPNFTVTFDYQFLDESPKSKSFGADLFQILTEHRNRLYFAPKVMSKCGRQQLMEHPIVLSLLSLKWQRLCRYFYYLRFFIYLIFNIFLNVIIIIEGKTQVGLKKENASSKEYLISNLPSAKSYGNFMGYLVISFALIQILNELSKLLVYRHKYFYYFENYLELTLYISTVVYMSVFLFQPDSAEEPMPIAILCIFLAWTNYLLYLQGLPLYRNYVSMFVQVCMTIFKLLIVFGIILFAFMVIFYLLFISEAGFRTTEDIMIKVLVMMTGEFEASKWLAENRSKLENNFSKLPYPEISFVTFILFLLLVSVAFTNLLIGLAVGDIEKIRSTAQLNNFKSQLHLIESIQGFMPKYVLKRFIYKPVLSRAVNKHTTLERLIQRLTSDTTCEDLKRFRMDQLAFESDQMALAMLNGPIENATLSDKNSRSSKDMS